MDLGLEFLWKAWVVSGMLELLMAVVFYYVTRAIGNRFEKRRTLRKIGVWSLLYPFVTTMIAAPVAFVVLGADLNRLFAVIPLVFVVPPFVFTHLILWLAGIVAIAIDESERKTLHFTRSFPPLTIP